MASLIEELINILDKEYEIYQTLIPVAEQKTQVIVKNDLEALQEITKQEQYMVDQIHVLEQKREVVVQNIGTVINRKPETLDLKTLVDLMEKQPKEQQILAKLHDNLKATIQRLVEVNNQNRLLIEESLEMIEFNMNVIQSARMSPGNNTYTKGASPYDSHAPGAGMFDAKQ